MTKAVELTALVGADPVDRGLGMAALAGRFDDGGGRPQTLARDAAEAGSQIV